MKSRQCNDFDLGSHQFQVPFFVFGDLFQSLLFFPKQLLFQLLLVFFNFYNEVLDPY